MKTYQILAMLLLASVLLAPLAGCSKVSQTNYDKIETGMTLAEVEDILGEGTAEASKGAGIGGVELTGKKVTWESGSKSITVTFLNGKATLKNQSGL